MTADDGNCAAVAIIDVNDVETLSAMDDKNSGEAAADDECCDKLSAMSDFPAGLLFSDSRLVDRPCVGLLMMLPT